MVVIVTTGPTLAIVPCNLTSELEERSTLPRANLMDLMSSSGYNPKVINLFDYDIELSSIPRWDRLNRIEKRAMFMDKFEGKLSEYGLQETVAVLGFFAVFTDKQIEYFLEHYNANVYIGVR